MLNLRMIRITAGQAAARFCIFMVNAIVFFSLLGVTAAVQAQPPAVLETAPDFALKSSTGHNLRLSEFRGGVAVVNFWSSDCGRCEELLGQLNAINAANRPNRISILSVNIDRDSHAATRAITDQGLEFPVLFDSDKTVVRLYDPNRLPMTVMIDPHGTIRYIHDGYKRGDETLYASELAELLAE